MEQSKIALINVSMCQACRCAHNFYMELVPPGGLMMQQQSSEVVLLMNIV